MINTFEYKQLKELGKQIRGVTYKKSDISESPKDGYIPLLRAHNINDRRLNYNKLVFIKEELVRDEQLLQNFDILIATSSGSKDLVGKSAQFYNSKYGKVTFGAFCKVVRPRTKNINPKYLGYFFQSEIYRRNINKVVIGSNINNLRNEHIDEQMLMFQNIEDQNKIVNIIEKSEFILNKKQQQIESLSALKQSIFLNIFKENKKYSNIKLSEVISSIAAGLSTGGENRVKKDGELGVLTTSSVTYGIFDSKAYKVPPNDKVKDKKLVFPSKNSILVSRMNTKELVGASCIVEEDHPELFIPDRIWKLIPNTEMVNPYYLISVIQSRMFRVQIDRISTGTSGSMQNISQKNYMNLQIPYVDLEVQNKFASKISTINNQLVVLNNSLEDLKSFYDALLNKAFNGQLFKEELKV